MCLAQLTPSGERTSSVAETGVFASRDGDDGLLAMVGKPGGLLNRSGIAVVDAAR